MERFMSKEGDGAEEALSSGEQELRLLVETIPALVWRAGPDGNIEYVNERVLEYFGAQFDEIIGWGWMEKVHPDDVEFKVSTWLEKLESGNPHDPVCTIRGADGRYRWFEVRGEPLRANDGTVLSWYGVLIDIDDRRKAEEALRESERKLRQFLESVPCHFWSANPDGVSTYLNQRLLKYFGIPRLEDQRPGDRYAVLHPDDAPETERVLNHAFQTGESFQRVHRLRRADGEYRWHRVRAEPVRDHKGDIVQWYGFSIDIDEGKKAEDALRKSEQSLRSAIDGIAGLMAVTGPNGDLEAINRQVIEYFGRSLEQMKSWGQSDAIHPEDLPRIADIFKRSMADGTSFHYELRLQRFDGEYRWFENRGAPVRDESGRIVRWYILGTDIEDRKRVEEALRRSEANLAEAQRLSKTGSWAINPSMTKILYWSEECYRTWGFDPEQGLPNREAVWRRIDPGDQDRMYKETQDALLQKRDYKVDFRILLPDGTVKYLEAIGHHLFSANGELVQVVGTNVDVTERKRAEEALRRNESYLAEAQRLSHTGTCVFDATTMLYLYWSNECYRIWGLDPIRGIPSREIVWQRIHPDDRDRVGEGVQEALRQKKDYAGEFKIVLPDGTVKYLASTMHHLFSAGGDIVEVIGTHIDVTDRKRAQEEHEKLRQLELELAHMNRLGIMGEQAASLAHEITQPIATARNNERP
jgi:PAS domain S-box-containing protein